MNDKDYFLIIILISLILVIIILLFGFFIFLMKKNKSSQNKIKNVNFQAEKIINKAIEKAKIESIKIKQEAKKFEWDKKKELIKNEKFLNQRTKNIYEHENMLSKQEKKNLEKEKIMMNKIDAINKELENIANISKQDAKEKLFLNLEFEFKKEMNKKIKEIERRTIQNSKNIAESIIVNAIEKYSPIMVADKTMSIVKFDNEEIKGKIIGKDGKNIRVFEKYSGVDLLIDDSPGIIRLSSFNSKRREIARIALEKLIDDGKIQPHKIEEYLKLAEKNLNNKIIKIGEDTFEKLNLLNVNSKLFYYLGLLKFRTSYGQNVLEHSIEVGKLAQQMALEVGLNGDIALRAGLLHDIGKSIDQDIVGSHVTLGVELAKKYKESKYIINAIESHHGDVDPNNFYSILVSAADTLSAARPGARNNSVENYIERMQKIEDLCSNISGVKECYALKSGRNIRIMVDAKNIDDLETYKITKEIRKKIENSNIIIPGDIVINVIRELLVVEKIIK